MLNIRSEVNVRECRSQNDFNAACAVASLFGTLQAGFTDFKYLSKRWKENTEEDSLIGVSLTGLASHTTFPWDLAAAAHIVNITNEIIAGLIGINPAKRTTTVKPSGTASLLLGTSSGIHAYPSHFYERRIFLKKSDKLVQYLQTENPEIIEDSDYSPDDAVVVVPLKAPEDCIIAASESTFDLLERIKTFNLEWVRRGHMSGVNTNNVSATVDYHPDDMPSIYAWLWMNKDFYNGITLFPEGETSSFTQLPFTPITEEEYEEAISKVKSLSFEIPEEDPEIKHELEAACSGGSCTITRM